MEQRTLDVMRPIFQLLRPPENMGVAEWANTNRYLSPESSAEPGKWDTNKTPYLYGMFEAFDNPVVEEITIMSSAQVGKSEFINNVVGKHIDQDPCPILLVQPTDDAVKKYSKERISTMIRDTPVLAEKIKDSTKKDSGNTVTHKMFPGGYLAMVGAHNPTGLASRSARLVVLDEIDRFPESAGNEGDPVSLAENRTKTFYNRKKVRVSTPTIAGKSKIDALFQESSKAEWCLPCPSCGTYVPLDWENVVGKDKEDAEIGMVCTSCGAIHKENEWKSKKQLNGKWIEEFPNKKKHKGFHLNEMASPWKSWEQMRDDYLLALKDLLKLINFHNTSLGLPFVENLEDKPKFEELLARREDYGADLPDGVLILTCAVDVQDNRLELEVLGWGLGEEKWGIEFKILPGMPSEDQVWEDLDRYLRKEFSFADGNKLGIVATCIDTGGHNTQETYDFISPRQNSRRIYGVKGLGGEYIPILNGFRPTKNKEISLLSLGINALKDTTYGSLRVKEIGHNYCHFPLDPEKGYGEEYFKQLTSETKMMKDRKVFWKKNGRNEALDIRNYNTAAFKVLNVNLEKLSAIAKEKLVKVGRVSKKVKRIKGKIHSKGVT